MAYPAMNVNVIRTSVERVDNRSNFARKAFRSVVNRFYPSLRWKLPYLSFDGPLPPARPNEVVTHGHKYVDSYSWLQELYDSQTQHYVKMERVHNDHVDNRLDIITGKFRLWSEFDTRIVITTREGGFDKGEERIGEYIYYTRDLEGEGTDLAFFRKRPGQADLLGEELINPHELRKDFGYSHTNIGMCRVSQDGSMLAYTLSVEGGDRFICHVKSINNSSIFHIIRTTNIISIEWGSGNHFFYTECNDLNRPHRVMMQEIVPGILPKPVEVYRDDDESFFVDVRKTKDNQFLVISSDAKGKGNVSVLPSTFPTIPKELKRFFPDRKPVEIAGKEAWGWLEHHEHAFVMVTSHNSPNYSVVWCREEVALKYGKAAEWTTLVPADERRQIMDIDLFKTHMVLFENTFHFDKLSQMRVVDLRQGLAKAAQNERDDDVILHFPPLAHLTPGLNKNWDQDTINFLYSSLTSAARECVYKFDSGFTNKQIRSMAASSVFTTRQHETLSPWDYMWPYTSYRDTCVSTDGTEVPISIYTKRDCFVEEITDYEDQANTPKHCLLYVYGAYGEVPAMNFQLPYMFLLRRRWTIAFAHVRGGGELPGWAEQGRGMLKHNTNDDFVACCKHLCDAGYTSPDKLCVVGASAGAVPIAAAMNKYGKNLFDMACLRAPFLDITTTMMDPDLPLSLAEREDWGDPLNNKAHYDYLQTYDPYRNLSPDKEYPSMVVSTCLDDDRVPAWNALKWVARLREIRTKQNIDPVRDPLILRVKSQGGHHHWTELLPQAEEIAFMIQHFNLPPVYYKPDDIDAMQQVNNFFKTGLLDHDDQYQTFLKWDTWEREKMEYAAKMHRMDHMPNFRALQRKKEPYYWATPVHSEVELQAQEAMRKAGHTPNERPGMS